MSCDQNTPLICYPLDVRHSYRSSTLLTAKSRPEPVDIGCPVFGYIPGQYITLDGSYGARHVWVREQGGGAGEWVLLRHGESWKVNCEATVLELYPDIGFPEQYCRLWVSNRPLKDMISQRMLGQLTDKTHFDQSARINAGVTDTKPTQFTGYGGTPTASWIVLDGSMGATVCWVNDSETTQLAVHGEPILVRGSVRVAPHPADLTSVVVLWSCSHPVRLPPITRRSVTQTLPTSSGETNNNFLFAHITPTTVTDEIHLYADGATSVKIDQFVDAGSGQAPTITNLSTTAVGAAGHATIAVGDASPLPISLRHTTAARTVTFRVFELRGSY